MTKAFLPRYLQAALNLGCQAGNHLGKEWAVRNWTIPKTGFPNKTARFVLARTVVDCSTADLSDLRLPSSLSCWPCDIGT